MKSRISYFNKTVFLKNLTRFAPCWGLYTVCALMGLILLLDSSSKHMAPNLIDAIQILSLITPVYALICTHLLFGDLYNSRMCNALHALPLRRETWFVTNVISGFVFHLIPTMVLTVLVLPILVFYAPENAWLAAPIFLLGTNLQFACFFGLSVFSAFCVGSRFAQAVVYAIMNFGAVIMGWLLDTLYVPQFYGIRLNFVPFFLFSPMARMMESSFVDVRRVYETEQLNIDDLIAFTFHPDENAIYYFVVAAVGIGLLFCALALYRRRKLECAGDFLAIRGLEPVFLVVYSLLVGAAFYFITDDVFGMGTPVFLFLGLAVGWFTGKMLLERSPRVFGGKNFLKCGILMAAVGLSMIIAALDPFGIVSWIPEAEEVETVTIDEGWYRPQNEPEDFRIENPEDIQKIIDIHREAVGFYQSYNTHQFRMETAAVEYIYSEENADRMNFSMAMTITYHLKSGRTVNRYYNIWMGDDTGVYLRRLFSSPAAVFGSDMTEDRFLAENSLLVLRNTWDGGEIFVHDPADIRSLYRSMVADCEEGTMSQQWGFHHPDDNVFWLNHTGEAINIFSNAEHTLNWLRDYGVDVDDILEKYGR